MRNYATLFDRNYLAKGLCLFASLMKHITEQSMLYILAMDVETVEILKKLEKLGWMKGCVITDLRDFENEDIIKAKGNRDWREFCWTMASQYCDGLMNENGLTNITYLDADLFFFNDPKIAHDELVGGSIGITAHRLLPEKKFLEQNGLFNVGWVTFKRNVTGQECLQRWAEDCLEWCYYKQEDGKFGDQKYLDAWPSRYRCCCKVLENYGVNAGPWNISQWPVRKEDGILKAGAYPLVCYHFHEFQKKPDGSFYYTGWPLQTEAIELIYLEYCAMYRHIENLLKETLQWAS